MDELSSSISSSGTRRSRHGVIYLTWNTQMLNNYPLSARLSLSFCIPFSVQWWKEDGFKSSPFLWQRLAVSHRLMLRNIILDPGGQLSLLRAVFFLWPLIKDYAVRCLWAIRHAVAAVWQGTLEAVTWHDYGHDHTFLLCSMRMYNQDISWKHVLQFLTELGGLQGENVKARLFSS